jgi:hypothetical protein
MTQGLKILLFPSRFESINARPCVRIFSIVAPYLAMPQGEFRNCWLLRPGLAAELLVLSASRFEEGTMRSELVFGATQHVANRYLLVRLAAKAVRAFHRPNTRIAETANDVLVRFGTKDPRPAWKMQTANVPR